MVTPEWEDQYLNSEIVLPRENKIARDQVVCWKCDANGKPTGEFKENPILDTQLYEVESPVDEITDLVSNIIAESICAQCGSNRNEYLLLEAFINHKKTDSALSM